LHDRSAEITAHLSGSQYAEAEEPDIAKQETNNETVRMLHEKK
jgi:hypothetical protein